MIRSFQMRLALQSTLVSAVVLTTFALVFWHFLAASHQQRLDRDLVGLAHQLLVSGTHSQDDLHLDSLQTAIYGEELSDAATLLTDTHQRIIFKSENWPLKLAPEILPQATHMEHTKLPRHGSDSHGAHNGHPENSHLDLHTEDNLIAPHFRTAKLHGDQWRLVGLSDGNRTLHVALDLATFNGNLGQIRGIMVLIVITALIILALGAWLVARRALKPLRSLTRMAEGITANELGQTISDDGADLEFSRLIRVFNEMLARLDASFRQAVRFSADASHELKTPLTVMQGEVETALQQAPNGSEAQATFASQLEEIQRLNNLVGKLLLLSHADSGALRPTKGRFDFTEMVSRIFEDILILDPNLEVESRLDTQVYLEGDQDLLRQAVQNLAVNAVRYNIHDGWIRCELSQIENTTVLRVSNSAIPIPTDESDKIFNRFYQVDSAREGNHYGLGLSLAREIAQVHGGKLVLVGSDDEGTIFELSLPI